MLTHQACLRESICEKMFPITYIKIGVAPCQLFSCLLSNNRLILN